MLASCVVVASLFSPADVPVQVSVGRTTAFGPTAFGQRQLVIDDLLQVVVHNKSLQPTRVWSDRCSWGYQNVALVLRPAGNPTEQVVKRKEGVFRRNGPMPLELAPGECVVFSFKLTEEEWPGLKLAEAGAKVRLAVRYTSAPSDEAREHRVWTGSVDTPPLEYAVAKPAAPAKP